MTKTMSIAGASLELVESWQQSAATSSEPCFRCQPPARCSRRIASEHRSLAGRRAPTVSPATEPSDCLGRPEQR